MRRNISLIGLGLMFGWTALAADATRFETYLGYDMLRYNSATNIPAFTANGAGGQFVVNFNSWLGAVADIYAAHNGNVFGSVTVNGVTYPGGKLDNTSTFYQFGPRVPIRKWSRVTPFVEMLMGADTVRASVPLSLAPGQSLIIAVPGGALNVTVNGGAASAKNIYVRASTAQTAFAYKLGGGLDIKMGKHLSFRPLETDLQYTRLQQLRYPQPNKSQYNFLYSTGFNFTFGGAQ